LRSECAQNYKEEHFLRQIEFRFAGKAPKPYPPAWLGLSVTEYGSDAKAITRCTIILIGAAIDTSVALPQCGN
jgi:hypothetical protein